MKATVNFFGYFRDIVPERGVQLTLPEGATLADLVLSGHRIELQMGPPRRCSTSHRKTQGGRSMPAISKLGHIGLHVKDLERAKRFYRDILGLQVTDEDLNRGVVFLSARPDKEHHELALFAGRNVGADALVLQQVSFRCDTLDDVIGFYQRLQQHGVEIDITASHGNAVGLYCFDPEGNRCEIYWGTGLAARQPYLEAVDLNEPKGEIMRRVEESVREHGTTGFSDPTLQRQRKVPVAG